MLGNSWILFLSLLWHKPLRGAKILRWGKNSEEIQNLSPLTAVQSDGLLRRKYEGFSE